MADQALPLVTKTVDGEELILRRKQGRCIVCGGFDVGIDDETRLPRLFHGWCKPSTVKRGFDHKAEREKGISNLRDLGA